MELIRLIDLILVDEMRPVLQLEISIKCNVDIPILNLFLELIKLQSGPSLTNTRLTYARSMLTFRAITFSLNEH